MNVLKLRVLRTAVTAAFLAAVTSILAGPLRAAGNAVASRRFDRHTAAFSLAFSGETSAYRDTAAFVVPRSTLAIGVVEGPSGDYVLTAEQGDAVRRGPRAWDWNAPAAPGMYTIAVHGPGEHGDTIALRAFVMVPATEVRGGMLRGYRIGSYPPPRGSAFESPAGFVEVTKETADARVSPHFTLRQFVCKEDPPNRWPKYVVLQPRLPLKLEAILEHVNELGVAVDTLHVMSAYRTPYYNHAIGDVQYSQHQFGSAADIYVDPASDDRMTDFTGDRRVDIGDSKFLYDQIEGLLVLKPFQRFQGGMGFYPATPAHPPFVHVDVRGTRARWRG